MQIRWSDHVLKRMRVREIEAEWVKRTVEHPEEVEPDPDHPGRMRVFAAVPERDGRLMRVVYEPVEGSGEVVIVTALLDRNRTRRRRRSGEA